jgi:hypothetical protein
MPSSEPARDRGPGRGGGPGFVTWTPFEQTLEGRRIHFQHRTDQGSDHVSQEAVGGDPELEHVAVAAPLRLLDDADEYIVLGLRRREGAEVVLAQEGGRALGERVLVHGRGHQRERRRSNGDDGLASPDPVDVRAPARGEAGMKAVLGLLRQPRRRRRRGARRSGRRAHAPRRAGGAAEARHLGERMNPRVGPAGNGEARPAGKDLVERGSKLASTVRCPGWAAQPAKSVPSYSSVSLNVATPQSLRTPRRPRKRARLPRGGGGREHGRLGCFSGNDNRVATRSEQGAGTASSNWRGQ